MKSLRPIIQILGAVIALFFLGLILNQSVSLREVWKRIWHDIWPFSSATEVLDADVKAMVRPPYKIENATQSLGISSPDFKNQMLVFDLTNKGTKPIIAYRVELKGKHTAFNNNLTRGTPIEPGKIHKFYIPVTLLKNMKEVPIIYVSMVMFADGLAEGNQDAINDQIERFKGEHIALKDMIAKIDRIKLSPKDIEKILDEIQECQPPNDLNAMQTEGYTQTVTATKTYLMMTQGNGDKTTRIKSCSKYQLNLKKQSEMLNFLRER